MKRNRPSRRAAAFFLLYAAQSVHAQFTDKVTTTPILIQDGFGPAGNQLLYDGGEYCCPTSFSMSLLYDGVNGFNQLGPSNPTLADGLNLDRIMSGLMATGATTGTTNTPRFLAAYGTYLNSKGISSANFNFSTYTLPTVAQLAAINQPGTTVNVITGEYVPSGNTYTRATGHCVALLNTGVDALGQSSAGTLVINNPLPGVFAPQSDVAGNSLQYLNTVPTTGTLTANGSMAFDHNQFPGYWGTAQDVIESAYALTINPSQQSINNPTLAPWTISSAQQLGPNGGTYTVLAPIVGTGGITQGTWGTVELQNTDDATGNNTVIAGALRSDVASGRPFGTGTIQLVEGTLQLMPAAGSANVSLTAADGAASQISFNGGCAIALSRNGNNSLAFQFGGNTSGGTANLARVNTGTLVIAPGSGNANLGTSEKIIINGSGANFPAVTNGIVAPYIVAEDDDGNLSGDFVTYGANGFTRAAYVSDSATPITATNNATVYRVQNGQTVPGNTTASVYAINVNSVAVGGGSSSTLNVGPQAAGQAGVILNGGTISTTNLNFGAAEGLVYASAAGCTINSIVQGSGGLTTFGPGALFLKGNNTYSGTTNINSGILVAANIAGSATGTGAVVVQQNGTLKVSGASAKAGSAAGTTTNFGGTLLLDGGTINGPLTMNFGSYLFGQGSVNGAASVFGTIGSSATDFGSAPFAGVENVTFTGSMNTSINTIYAWRLNALDDTPANAGTNWSILKFTGPNNAGNPINLGTTNNPIHIDLDLGPNVPDANSGNAFWSVSHQWTVANATSGFTNIWIFQGFGSYADGSFALTVDGALHNLYVNYAPHPSTWNVNSNGNWTASGNWSSFVPNSVNAVAAFVPVIGSPRTVTVDLPQTLGILNFNSPVAYTLAGSNSITLSASEAPAQINVTTGLHTISVPVNFASSTTIATAAATGLNLGGPVTTTAGNTIAVSGGGIVSFASAAYLANLSIGANCTVVMTKQASHANHLVLVTDAISFASNLSGKLDLNDNDLIIHQGNLSNITTEITTGASNGPGIASSVAFSDSTHKTALGIMLNDNGSGQPIYNTFDSQPVSAADVLVKYTYYGDSNLDGKIDGSDYSRIDSGFLSHLTSWYNGDFNHDQMIDGSDYTLIDNAFNSQGAAIAATLAGSAETVPEPNVLGLIAAAAALSTRSRRRVSGGNVP